MKENLISDKSLIYQWYFNDNISVVDNPRVKAVVQGNPTYNNGVATFNGSTDYYKLKTLINLGTKYSVEVRFKLNALTNCIIIDRNTTNHYLLYFDISGNKCYTKSNGLVSFTTTFNLNWNTINIVRNGTSTKMYLNGVEQTTSGVSSATDNMLLNKIAADENGANKLNGQLEYIKIWNRQLSASEVKNNYTGKTYKALPYVSSEILGNEIVSNNNYDTNTYWVKQPGWTINNGTAICTSIPATGAIFYPAPIVITGKLYKITYTILQCTAGIGFAAGVGNNIGQYRNIAGTYTDYLNCGNTQNVGIYGATGTSGVVDNISVKEVLQSSKNTLFHINSDNGVIRDLTGKTTPVNTNMTLKPLGSNIRVVNGNGTNSNLALGSNLITGDLTFLTVLNTTSLGEGSSNQYGMIFSNSKLQIWINDSTNRIGISRDGGTTKVYSNNNIIKFGNTVFLMITTTSTGISNIYSCELNSNLTLASTANLSAGSLVDTAHLTYIGDDGTGNRTFNGWLSNTMMIQGILTIEEGSQYVSSIKYKYQ